MTFKARPIVVWTMSELDRALEEAEELERQKKFVRLMDYPQLSHFLSRHDSAGDARRALADFREVIQSGGEASLPGYPIATIVRGARSSYVRVPEGYLTHYRKELEHALASLGLSIQAGATPFPSDSDECIYIVGRVQD